jgi:CubicO group peptidase (beta-lactamase class C family)
MTVLQSRGSCDTRYENLRAEFDKRLANGDDFGASLAVIERGELVVDLWGGYANAAKTVEWQENTLVNTWSITKTMTALSMLILVDRGQVHLDSPVAQYWPEFATAGKESVLVKHLLSHSSGVAAWEPPIDMVDICDIPHSTALLAEQEPWWEPGTASGYHVLSYGHLIGEVIRRVTGKTLPQFFRDEVAKLLDADFHIALPLPEHQRVAETIPGPIPPLPPEGTVGFRAFTGPLPVAEYVNTPTWRRAGIGGAGGHGNARAIAKAQSVISHGGSVAGMQLLKSETIKRALETQVSGEDLVMGQPIDFGLGYALAKSGLVPFIPSREIAFWAGAGGSLVINDIDRETTFAYAMNRMEGGMLGNPNSIAYYTCFDALQSKSA